MKPELERWQNAMIISSGFASGNAKQEKENEIMQQLQQE